MPGYEIIPREDFPTSIEKALEALESYAGFQFIDSRWKIMGSEKLTFAVFGVNMDGRPIAFHKELSGRGFVLLGEDKYPLFKALRKMGPIFNKRIRQVKNPGEDLREIGVDTGGLELGSMVSMEEMFEGMGIETPGDLFPFDKELTKEEKKGLNKQWRDSRKEWED